MVRQLLDRFERNPTTTPLPVLINGSGDDLEALVKKALGKALITDDILPTHLEAGDFLLIIDGLSESGIAAESLSAWSHGYPSTPFLLSSRPVEVYRRIFVGGFQNAAPYWGMATPLRLDEDGLHAFIRHYGGGELSEPIKRACRGRDGTYLPILVRMAIDPPDDGTVASVSDIYRDYCFKLIKQQIPDETERFQWLRNIAEWCLQTYWRNGQRRMRYDGEHPQQELKDIGMLVAAGGDEPPKEVQFFHDSMQSYLTAYALAEQDREDAPYSELPHPREDTSEKAWDRSRVLL